MRTEQLLEMRRLEDTYWWFVGRRRLVRRLTQRYCGAGSVRLLDVGCGTGGTLVALAGLGELYGCDASWDALAHCQRRGLRNLVRCGAEDLAFADSRFDVVLSCDVLEHIAGDVRALSELRRVLKPGGHAIITVPAHPWLWSEHDEALSHLRRYRRAELARKLAHARLRPVLLTYAVSTLLAPIIAYRAYRALQRLRRGPQGPRTALVELPEWLNRLAIGITDLESSVMLICGVPLGTSLVCVAQADGAA